MGSQTLPLLRTKYRMLHSLGPPYKLTSQIHHPAKIKRAVPLGEFSMAPIPLMKAGEPVFEVVFEVDVNGILDRYLGT